MSVDINWETLTGGDDGEALAEAIRGFIHERFQQIHFPKLIRSVKVHGFDFGTIKPEIILKDVGDPLHDFYEDGDDDDLDVDDPRSGRGHADGPTSAPQLRPTDRHSRARPDGRRLSEVEFLESTQSPIMGRGGPAAMLGGTSGLGYFHLPLSAGLSGTSTPLAAVAGAHWHNGLPTLAEGQQHHHHHADSFSSVTPPTLTPVSSRPVSRDTSYFENHPTSGGVPAEGSASARTPSRGETEHAQGDRSPEDMQVVFHLTYSGDVRLSMTAEVFLDYPMPSFVGIPLKLNITGATFNGVGILAYIKKRAHLCFLSPDDAEALVGGDVMPTSPDSLDAEVESRQEKFRVGGLLEEIKIESEMGETTDGRQVLKNVGKIEKFILEQVQRIFEEEFVYPSFWTFLV